MSGWPTPVLGRGFWVIEGAWYSSGSEEAARWRLETRIVCSGKVLMSVDNYAICPCGSGKKIKFCKCKDSVGELDRVLKMVEGGRSCRRSIGWPSCCKSIRMRRGLWPSADGCCWICASTGRWMRMRTDSFACNRAIRWR